MAEELHGMRMQQKMFTAVKMRLEMNIPHIGNTNIGPLARPTSLRGVHASCKGIAVSGMGECSDKSHGSLMVGTAMQTRGLRRWEYSLNPIMPHTP
jgi:hypothetical protein